MSVELSEPDPSWPARFAQEAERLREALGARVLDLHHIGSTAIRGIVAKPIIDMLLVTDQLQQLDRCDAVMRGLGYEVMGEFGIAGRRYFRKSAADGRRTHHLHAFEAGSPHITRHLAFRDLMNADAAAARAYDALKRRVAEEAARGGPAYAQGKADFVARHEALALRREGPLVP